MNFEENYKRELGKYNRHDEFFQFMINNRHLLNIDWDNYWSCYYHSNISKEEALNNSKY